MLALDLSDVAARIQRSVVQVMTGAHGTIGHGAGVIWPGGAIVTNAHVATDRTIGIILPDGRRTRGDVLERDARRDLAVIDAGRLVLPAIEVADPRELRAGVVVLALGHPMGVTNAVTTGILQATGPLPFGLGPLQHRPSQSWVQADVRLAPGNSGGPLVDARGRVLGVVAMIAAGLALAVPSPEIDAFVAAVWRKHWTVLDRGVA